MNRIAFILACLWAAPTFAQQRLVSEPIQVTLRIVDQDHNPVRGAKISATGGNNSFQMPLKSSSGELTDENGEIVFKFWYPITNEEGGDVEPLLFVRTSHVDFVPSYRRLPFGGRPIEIVLERGFRIAISAVDLEGNQVKEGLFAIHSHFENLGAIGCTWKLHESGLLVSSTFPLKTIRLRVVHAEQGKPTFFSKDISIHPRGRNHIVLRDVKLQPGVQVQGKVDSKVPRPVEGGYVAGYVIGDGGWKGHLSTWLWADIAEIKSDGSFVFESLPADSVLQMFAFSEGWISKPSTQEETSHLIPDIAKLVDFDGSIFLPQVQKLTSERVNLAVEMEPATSLKVIVVDETGEPVRDAVVSALPSQVVLGCYTTGIGVAVSTKADLLKEDYRQTYRSLDYGSVTDVNGEVVLDGLPPNHIYVGSEELGLLQAVQLQRDQQVTLEVEVGRQEVENHR